jgi:hypothetical protein
MPAVYIRFWKAPGQIDDTRKPVRMKTFRERTFSDKNAAFWPGYDLAPAAPIQNMQVRMRCLMEEYCVAFATFIKYDSSIISKVPTAKG